MLSYILQILQKKVLMKFCPGLCDVQRRIDRFLFRGHAPLQRRHPVAQADHDSGGPERPQPDVRQGNITGATWAQ